MDEGIAARVSRHVDQPDPDAARARRGLERRRGGDTGSRDEEAGEDEDGQAAVHDLS